MPDLTLSSGAVLKEDPNFSPTSKIIKERSSDPPNPPANSVILYAKDNGAGKTQLMVRFSTGAPIQLAIEA